MASVTVRNISASSVTIQLHLNGALTSYTIASGATQAIDAKCLDQAIDQGARAHHNPLSVLDPTGATPGKYAIIPVTVPA